jgi:hypothetical protein
LISVPLCLAQQLSRRKLFAAQVTAPTANFGQLNPS